MKMGNFLEQILEDKKREVRLGRRQVPLASLRRRCQAAAPCRSLEKVLAKPGPAGVNIIAEVKRASPSKGPICPGADAAAVARQYQRAGAAAVSVLTDSKYFQGHLEDLRQVKLAVGLPVLRKDFIIDTYQVYQARAAGADAVLLIARILTPGQLEELVELARRLDMETLVEIHAGKELETVTAMGVGLVAINNRDLTTFRTDPDTARRLAAGLKSWQVAVAASTISSPEDIALTRRAGIFNFLVGESLMRAGDRSRFLKDLLYGWKQGA